MALICRRLTLVIVTILGLFLLGRLIKIACGIGFFLFVFAVMPSFDSPRLSFELVMLRTGIIALFCVYWSVILFSIYLALTKGGKILKKFW